MLGLGLGINRGFVGGGAVAPSYTPPLDTYTGATAAYSVRKLSSSYSGSCIEAYRVSDGATQDIGFDADGLIDTAAIISFASGGEVRVRTWYDQSGNALDAVQTTALQMPQIYDGSAVNTENDTPAILWDGTNQTYLQTGLYDAWSDGSSFTTMVFNGRRGPSGSHTYWDIETGVQRYSSGVGNIFALFYGTSQLNVSSNVAPTTQGIHTWYSVASETDAAVYIDGALKGTNTRTNPVGDTNVSAYIGSRIGGSQWNSCHYQEIIHWGSDVASTRTGLESNLNDYYQIANLPASSSGLLYDYPDAAAAYSVRSLSNNAIKCMRVRRDNDDAELDIGFDGDGNLDTAAIATHCGVNNGYVSKWYDQSGNSNDAAQATFGSQPQIYNGTAVVTENGKPILIGGQLNYGSTITYTNNLHSVFNVLRYDANAIYASSYNSGITNHYSANFRSGLAFEKVGGLTGYHSLGASPSSGAQQMVSIIDDATNVKTNVNGISSSVSSIGPYTAVTTLTHRGEFSLSPDVKIQEQLVYLSDQTTNRTAIESNINDYYSIYT